MNQHSTIALALSLPYIGIVFLMYKIFQQKTRPTSQKPDDSRPVTQNRWVAPKKDFFNLVSEILKVLGPRMILNPK